MGSDNPLLQNPTEFAVKRTNQIRPRQHSTVFVNVAHTYWLARKAASRKQEPTGGFVCALLRRLQKPQNENSLTF